MTAELDLSHKECRGNPAEPPPRISSRTAEVVLGEANMENWRHVRYLSTLMEWCVRSLPLVPLAVDL